MLDCKLDLDLWTLLRKAWSRRLRLATRHTTCLCINGISIVGQTPTYIAPVDYRSCFQLWLQFWGDRPCRCYSGLWSGIGRRRAAAVAKDFKERQDVNRMPDLDTKYGVVHRQWQANQGISSHRSARHRVTLNHLAVRSATLRRCGCSGWKNMTGRFGDEDLAVAQRSCPPSLDRAPQC